MSALHQYVERLNATRSFWGGRTYNLDRLTRDDVQSLYEQLDSDMSPECLFSDGEASASVVRDRMRRYDSVMRELGKLAQALEVTR